jgi:hypothetical protein
MGFRDMGCYSGGATKCDNFRGFSGDGDGRGAMRAGDTQVVLKKEGKWERKGGGATTRMCPF